MTPADALKRTSLKRANLQQRVAMLAISDIAAIVSAKPTGGHRPMGVNVAPRTGRAD